MPLPLTKLKRRERVPIYSLRVETLQTLVQDRFFPSAS
jgi:hypothetical protein